MSKSLSEKDIINFKQYLIASEKSTNTVEKYLRDVKKLYIFLNNPQNNPPDDMSNDANQGKISVVTITKELVIDFKKSLCGRYKTASINSILAALNCFFTFMKLENFKVKFLKVQHRTFSDETRELTRLDYDKLCETAMSLGKQRTLLAIRTLCATGIRVSELKFVTVETVSKGEAVVCLKGKIRTIFFVSRLKSMLLAYATSQNITSGEIFLSENGKTLNRTCIWRDMKGLCEEAGVSPEKVFPHNLRHLFARTFYDIDKDLAKLADILGHSSINTTRIYIASTGEEHKKCMEQMGLVT